MIDQSGIYCFYFNEHPNEFYIGIATNILLRVQWHISALKRGTHYNKKVQNYYSKYGEPIFEVLETCSVSELYKKEIFYINEFDSYRNGLNLTAGGEGGGFGEGCTKALYTLTEYKECLYLLAYTNFTMSEIAKYVGVSLAVVKSIASLRAHTYLKEYFPSEYKKVEDKKYSRGTSAKDKGIAYPIILSPQGIEYLVDNVHQFAKNHNLQYQNLHKVLIGKRRKHLGWQLK